MTLDSIRKLNERISVLPNQMYLSELIDLKEKINIREKVVSESISGLQIDTKSICSNVDSEAIKFGQLGFWSSEECDTWMEIHHPIEDFGM